MESLKIKLDIDTFEQQLEELKKQIAEFNKTDEVAEALKSILADALNIKRASEELPYVLTVDDVAKTLRIGKSSVYELVSSGQIPAKKIMGQYRIPRDAFIKWLSNTEKNEYKEKLAYIGRR
ncbi:MAG: helix-turn-helix domain-containing protein [Thermovenabulum sp.]|uniref:helix-turn-helix domain-containing protein n=1 Tax=Thermovenabulum sp. TaxID=3100335 RepID=UPI003C7AA60A